MLRPTRWFILSKQKASITRVRIKGLQALINKLCDNEKRPQDFSAKKPFLSTREAIFFENGSFHPSSQKMAFFIHKQLFQFIIFPSISCVAPSCVKYVYSCLEGIVWAATSLTLCWLGERENGSRLWCR
jgi:hypothetical protein